MHPPSSICDVIVIGGGAIGLACARTLARRGASVTLFDRQRCGQEASWAGAGIIESGSWLRDDPFVHLQRASVAAYPAFAEQLLDETGIDPEYERRGSFKLIYDETHHHRASIEVQAAQGHQSAPGDAILELLSGKEAREREPLLADDILAVQYNRLSGQVRNPRLLAALIASCQRLGVQIRENESVTGILHGRGVNTTSGPVHAAHVVLAAGAWSSQIEPALAALLPVQPVRGQIVLLEAPQRPFTRVIKEGRCYLVARRDGRVLVGATQEPDAGFEKRTTPEGVHGLMSMAQRWAPTAGAWKLERAWAGLRPGTPDNRPYIGPVPGWKGLWAATGHFRCGLTLAPVTAAIIADLVATGRTQYNISLFLPGEDRADRNAANRR